MKKVNRLIKRSIASLIAAGRSPEDPDRGLAILAYHSTHATVKHPHWLDFYGQMALIEDLGYRVVSLDTAVELLRRRERIRQPTLALTFDDGFADNLDVAFPALAKRGWPATVFIATSFLGGSRYLLPDQVRLLPDLGIELGNHTDSHPDLTSLDPGRIHEEIRQCSRRIEDLVGRRPEYFCYPYGRYNGEVRSAVAASEMEAACTGRVGHNRAGQDPFTLRRLTLEPGDGPKQLRDRLAGGYDFLDLKQRYMDRG